MGVLRVGKDKSVPQGLKPVLCCVANVRAEARTLQEASSHADSLALVYSFFYGTAEPVPFVESIVSVD
jgi:hypothetical protein